MSLTNPQFTVIIPLYNKSAHIIDTIQAVLRQTYSATEIIVVNDGSTDDGAERLAAENFSNVRIIHQQNAGVSAARNNGIRAANTEFIALIDADDHWLPHYLEEIADLTDKFPEAGLYSTGYQYRDDNDLYAVPRVDYNHCPRIPGLMPNFFEVMANGDLPINMSSIVIRRSLFDAIGGFPEGEPMGEDQDFLFRAALAKPIAYSPRVLSFYVRDSQNRVCVSNLPSVECPFSSRLANIAGNPLMPQALSTQMKKCSAAHLLHLVRRNVQANQISAAQKLIDDPRCALKPLQKLYWQLRIVQSTLRNECHRYLNVLLQPQGVGA